MPSVPETLRSLRRLEKHWEDTYPERALGGIRAAAGFRYQFLAALLALVRSWLERPANEQARPNVFVESLSDTVQLDDDVVLVTQVKRTRASAKVRAALDELWLINELARERTPDLIPRLRFRVLAAHSVSGNVDNWVTNWRPDGDVDEERLATFKEGIETTLEPNPEDDLLGLLVNKLEAADPLGLVLKWLGGLQEAAEDPATFDKALRDVWNDLQDLRQADERKPAGVYLWTAVDQPPTDVTPGEYLTGQQPRVHHLQDGFFAPRPGVYGDVATTATAWIDGDPVDTTSLKVPIFWVGGRSGCGKSVALLHLLATLHADGHGIVLWLGDRVAALPIALAWAKKMRRPDERILIGVDDPYAPIEQSTAGSVWSQVLDELHEARERGEAEEIPLILACGPSEQADRLVDELRRDVTVHRHDLPFATTEGLAPLREWFHQRSGKAAPDLADENVLLVQLFFEWRTERTLDDFAVNLRTRLLKDDPSEALFKTISLLLAANRLYVGLPKGVLEAKLSADQLDDLDVLRKEEHIATDLGGRSGEWLTHPHLANVVYEAWHSGSNRQRHKGHLAEAVRLSIEHGRTGRDKMALLWAVLRTLTDGTGTVLEGRLDPRSARAILENLHKESTRIGRLPIFQLPLWIEATVMLPDLGLTSDPVEEAIAVLRPENLDKTGLRLTCHKLIGHLGLFPASQRKRIQEVMVSFLSDKDVLAWHEWIPIMDDLMGCTRDSRLWPMVASWCCQNRSAPRFLKRAVEFSKGNKLLQDVASDLLRDAPGHKDWGGLAICLSSFSAELPSAVRVWAEKCRLTLSACFLLRHIRWVSR